LFLSTLVGQSILYKQIGDHVKRVDISEKIMDTVFKLRNLGIDKFEQSSDIQLQVIELNFN